MKCKKVTKLPDSDIYHIVMLHSYQRKSCREIARQFGVSSGEIYEILASRTSTTCCG